MRTRSSFSERRRRRGACGSSGRAAISSPVSTARGVFCCPALATRCVDFAHAAQRVPVLVGDDHRDLVRLGLVAQQGQATGGTVRPDRPAALRALPRAQPRRVRRRARAHVQRRSGWRSSCVRLRSDAADLAAAIGLVSALAKAMCHIHRVTRAEDASRSAKVPRRSRILVLSLTPDSASAYIALMNVIFSAQKAVRAAHCALCPFGSDGDVTADMSRMRSQADVAQTVPIDVCKLSGAESEDIVLQQAASLTNGVYLAPERRSGLLQHLFVRCRPAGLAHAADGLRARRSAATFDHAAQAGARRPARRLLLPPQDRRDRLRLQRLPEQCVGTALLALTMQSSARPRRFARPARRASTWRRTAACSRRSSSPRRPPRSIVYRHAAMQQRPRETRRRSFRVELRCQFVRRRDCVRSLVDASGDCPTPWRTRTAPRATASFCWSSISTSR